LREREKKNTLRMGLQLNTTVNLTAKQLHKFIKERELMSSGIGEFCIS
jgi:hypothetical protein